jgi:hypothetical protein
VLLVPLVAWPAGVTGQAPRLTLIAGVSEFDLSGTGRGFIGGARIDTPLSPALILEGGVAAMSAPQAGDTTVVVLPEALAQVQLPRRLAPYLGLGLGVAVDVRDEEFGGTQIDPTFIGAAGIRLDLTESAGLRVELRVRGHETGFVGTTADWTGGVSWRF